MCLDKLEKFDVSTEEGYKVFKVLDGKLSGLFWTENEVLDVGQIMESKSIPTNTDEGEFYFSGFHLFLTEGDAKAYISKISVGGKLVIRKVAFEDVITTGFDRGVKTVVARVIALLDKEIKIEWFNGNNWELVSVNDLQGFKLQRTDLEVLTREHRKMFIMKSNQNNHRLCREVKE